MCKYRIENSNVYKYSDEHNAYLFYCKTYVCTKRELNSMKKELS